MRETAQDVAFMRGRHSCVSSLTEILNAQKRILTLDRDFQIYSLAGKRSIEVSPS